MSLIDSILNIACVLLWFSWRSMHFDPLARRKPTTLLGTLRPVRTARVRGWMILASVPALLVLRAVLYWQIGSPVDWIPKPDLGIVVIAFRVDRFLPALLYSFFSLLHFTAIIYVWLVAIVLVNRRLVDPDPILRLVRLQVGRLARAPALVQMAVPIVVIICLWGALHPLLSLAGILGPFRSISQIIRQGLLVAGGVVVTLKLLFPAILLMHMLSSYVYLGSSPFWEFITNTGRNVLAPLPVHQLRTAKLDFAPLAGMLIILLALHTLPTFALAFAASQGVTVWPE